MLLFFITKEKLFLILGFNPMPHVNVSVSLEPLNLTYLLCFWCFWKTQAIYLVECILIWICPTFCSSLSLGYTFVHYQWWNVSFLLTIRRYILFILSHCLWCYLWSFNDTFTIKLIFSLCSIYLTLRYFETV